MRCIFAYMVCVHKLAR